MAKLVVEVDTEAGTMFTTVNGKTVEDVQSVNCYCYDMDEPCAHFEVNSSSKNDKVLTRTTIYASEAGKKKIAAEKDEIQKFIMAYKNRG